MKKHVIIVGAGPAGLFAAYKLCNKHNIDITILDRGKDINHRVCPMREGKACANCKPCNIMCGFGGAGSFSDSKLSLSPVGVGGDILDYVDLDRTNDYIKEVTGIFNIFDDRAKERKIIGEKTEKYKEIENKLKKQNLNLTYCPTKHLGTDGTLEIMKKFYSYLKNKGVNFVFNETVTDFNEDKTVFTEKGHTYKSDYIIFAPGRSGNSWLSEKMKNRGVKVKSDKCDIGYRIELPAKIVKELTDNLYDMKISCNYPDTYYDVKVRTFCTNPNGFVSEEKYDNSTALANGHSYTDRKSNNTNFAVLATYKMTAEQGKNIIDLFNTITKGNIIVNNFDYMFKNKNKNIFDTEPTLKVNSDLRILDYTPSHLNIYILDFLHKLNSVYPGITSNTTNIYGMEAKFYSDTIEVKNNFETAIPGIYCAGDGSGITRGIIQSSCTGLVIADDILNKI